MEAFSDAVIAIVITIMVLEMRVPHGVEWSVLAPILPVFLSYVLSFVHLGIYWHNHHHLLHACHKVDGRVLWANTHLLFWLSLIPFVTGWMGENHFARHTVALYGVILLMSAIAYYILTLTLIGRHGRDSAIARALGYDVKGKVSVIIYLLAIPLALVSSWIGGLLYVAVAVMWLVPDRRIEDVLVKGA